MELIRKWYDNKDHISIENIQDRKNSAEKRKIEKAVEQLEQYCQRQSDEFVAQMLPGQFDL